MITSFGLVKVLSEQAAVEKFWTFQGPEVALLIELSSFIESQRRASISQMHKAPEGSRTRLGPGDLEFPPPSSGSTVAVVPIDALQLMRFTWKRSALQKIATVILPDLQPNWTPMIQRIGLEAFHRVVGTSSTLGDEGRPSRHGYGLWLITATVRTMRAFFRSASPTVALNRIKFASPTVAMNRVMMTYFRSASPIVAGDQSSLPWWELVHSGYHIHIEEFHGP